MKTNKEINEQVLKLVDFIMYNVRTLHDKDKKRISRIYDIQRAYIFKNNVEFRPHFKEVVSMYNLNAETLWRTEEERNDYCNCELDYYDRTLGFLPPS